MKRILFLCLLLIITIVSTVYCLEIRYERNQPLEVVGFHDVYEDLDVDNTLEDITGLDSNYLQMTTNDTIEISSSSDSDTSPAYITLVGVNPSGNRVTEEVILTGTTVASGSTTFSALESAYINTTSVGDITIAHDTGDTMITRLFAGTRSTLDAVKFAGEKDLYITKIIYGTSTSTGDILFVVRKFNSITDLRAGTYFEVIDYASVAKWSSTAPSDVVHNFEKSPLKIPTGGVIKVYGTGSTTDCDAYVTLDGYYLTAGQ